MKYSWKTTSATFAWTYCTWDKLEPFLESLRRIHVKKSQSASRFALIVPHHHWTSGSISDWQSVFRQVLSPARFPVGRVCSAKSGSNSGRQSVFHRVPGQFPVGRVSSAASHVDFWWAEDVPPRPMSIFDLQSVFRHVMGWFPIGRVCSVASRVNFQSLNRHFVVVYILIGCLSEITQRLGFKGIM